MHNGVPHDPDKLKQLEIERLELGWYPHLVPFTLSVLTLLQLNVDHTH